MSIENVSVDGSAGFPQLSPLGKRIEFARLDRRLTKGQLAGLAGISRQQLWRVMTAKSDLTDALRARLATVLQTDSRSLTEVGSDGRASDAAPLPQPSTSIAEYIADRACLERTLSTLPTNGDGRRLKRELLNALEDLATDASLALPPHFFKIRREVVNGDR